MADAYSRRFDRALVLAALVHEGVPRKGTVVPYVIHPVHVAAILLKYGYGEGLVTAALLHDVLEDIEYDNGRLQLAIRSAFPGAGLPDRIMGGSRYREQFTAFLSREFDDDVLALVRAVTEPKNAGGPLRSWADRKQDTLSHLESADDDVLALKAADALHNVRSILEDIEHHGAEVLNRFNAAPSEVLWYFGRVSALVRERLGSAPIADELERATEEFARFVGTIASP